MFLYRGLEGYVSAVIQPNKPHKNLLRLKGVKKITNIKNSLPVLDQFISRSCHPYRLFTLSGSLCLSLFTIRITVLLISPVLKPIRGLCHHTRIIPFFLLIYQHLPTTALVIQGKETKKFCYFLFLYRGLEGYVSAVQAEPIKTTSEWIQRRANARNVGLPIFYGG